MPAAAFALLLLTAQPSEDAGSMKRLEPAFTGTIVSTYDDGRQGHLNLARDGAYRYRGRAGKPSSGTWSLKGEQVCLKQRKPAIPFGSYCTPIPNGKTWTAKAAGGERITLRVQPGRV